MSAMSPHGVKRGLCVSYANLGQGVRGELECGVGSEQIVDETLVLLESWQSVTGRTVSLGWE